MVNQRRSGNTKMRKWKGIESYQDATLITVASDDIPAPPRQVHWSESVGSTTDSAVDEEENVEGEVDGGELANGDDQSVEGDPEEENIQPLTILTDPCVFIQPPSESDRWYVVIKGWRIGVFDNW